MPDAQEDARQRQDWELIGLAEVAGMLGKSRAWLYESRNRDRLYAAGFPRPRDEDALGLFWVHGAVRRWILGETKPSEPSLPAPAANDAAEALDYAAAARARMRALGPNL